MAAGAGTDQDQPVDAGLQGALGVGDVGHVVEHQAAVALGRLHHVVGCAQRGDLDRHVVLLAEVDVVLQAVVGAVHDLVDREGRHLLLGMLLLVLAQLRVMRCSHSSSISLGRAFSAGKAPTMPALHCSITRSGLETMNSGAPTTGMERIRAAVPEGPWVSLLGKSVRRIRSDLARSPRSSSISAACRGRLFPARACRPAAPGCDRRRP